MSTSKRNANIVSLTKAEKSATVMALQSQVSILEAEPVHANPVVNQIVAEQIDTLNRVILKVAD